MARPRGSRKQKEQAARLELTKGKAFVYIRVSTSRQQVNGYSLEGQEQRARAVAEREGLEVVEVVSDVGSGGKKRERLAEIQKRIEAGEAGAIITPKLDRLGRSSIHTATVAAWAVERRVDLLTSDEGWLVRDGKAVDKMLPFRIAMAEVERQQISERTIDALAVARTRGVCLGNVKRTGATDPAAKRAVELRRKGQTLAAIAATLNAEGYTTARGCQWVAGNLYNVLKRVAPDVLPEGATPRRQGNRGRR